MSNAAQIELGSVVSLWRYPVKSMMGEELNATEVTERGLLGDRAYALVDSSDGKVATAKNPRKWPRLFDFRATFIEPARAAAKVPPVRIALPDGTTVTSDQGDLNQILSKALNREVTLGAAQRGAVNAEEYWPDMEGLDHRDTVTDFTLPEGTFFDVCHGPSIDHGHARSPARAVSARPLRGPAVSSEHRGAAGLRGEGLCGECLGRPHARHRDGGAPEHLEPPRVSRRPV